LVRRGTPRSTPQGPRLSWSIAVRGLARRAEVPRDVRAGGGGRPAQRRLSRRGTVPPLGEAPAGLRRARRPQLSAERVPADLPGPHEPGGPDDGTVALSADGAHGYPGPHGGGV